MSGFLTSLPISRAPVLFYKPVTSLIGPLADVIIPKIAQPGDKHLPDYEVELTIVIGKPAKNVSEADALDYVLGYTGANDVSHPNQYIFRIESTDYRVVGLLPVSSNACFAMGLFERIR